MPGMLVNKVLDLCQGCFLLALYFSFSSLKVGLIFLLVMPLKKKKPKPLTEVPQKNCHGSGLFSSSWTVCPGDSGSDTNNNKKQVLIQKVQSIGAEKIEELEELCLWKHSL